MNVNEKGTVVVERVILFKNAGGGGKIADF
jgi:hypothetical protein